MLGTRSIGGHEVLIWTEAGRFRERSGAGYDRIYKETIEHVGIADTGDHSLLAFAVLSYSIDAIPAPKWDGDHPARERSSRTRKVVLHDVDGDGVDDVVLQLVRTTSTTDDAQTVIQVRLGRFRAMSPDLARCPRLPGDGGELAADQGLWRGRADLAPAILGALESATPSGRACLVGNARLASRFAVDKSTQDVEYSRDDLPTDVTPPSPVATTCPAAGWRARHGDTQLSTRYVGYLDATGSVRVLVLGDHRIESSWPDAEETGVARMVDAVVDGRLLLVAGGSRLQAFDAGSPTAGPLLDLELERKQRWSTSVVDGTLTIEIVGGRTPRTLRYLPDEGAFDEP